MAGCAGLLVDLGSSENAAKSASCSAVVTCVPRSVVGRTPQLRAPVRHVGLRPGPCRQRNLTVHRLPTSAEWLRWQGFAVGGAAVKREANVVWLARPGDRYRRVVPFMCCGARAGHCPSCQPHSEFVAQVLRLVPPLANVSLGAWQLDSRPNAAHTRPRRPGAGLVRWAGVRSDARGARTGQLTPRPPGPDLRDPRSRPRCGSEECYSLLSLKWVRRGSRIGAPRELPCGDGHRRRPAETPGGIRCRRYGGDGGRSRGVAYRVAEKVPVFGPLMRRGVVGLSERATSG